MRVRGVAAVLTVASIGVLAAGRPGAQRAPETRPAAFDLAAPSPVFFTHLQHYTDAAAARGIVTMVALYNAWMNNSRDGWLLNPFNPRNNVNPETDPLVSQDDFIRELGLAVAGDTTTATRRFLRAVWQTLTREVARHTPAEALLLPISEDFKDTGQFDKPAFYRQTAAWWGKTPIVDNVRSATDRPVAGATYKDVHDSRERFGLLLPGTIADTDDRCAPPDSPVISRMSRAAVLRGSNYLVYDCEVDGSAWNPRVIDALAAGLERRQPAADVRAGRGSLVGYGFPDVWINIVATGRHEAFLDALAGAGGNFTFVLIVLNPSVGTLMPWLNGAAPGGHDDVSSRRSTFPGSGP